MNGREEVNKRTRRGVRGTRGSQPSGLTPTLKPIRDTDGRGIRTAAPPPFAPTGFNPRRSGEISASHRPGLGASPGLPKRQGRSTGRRQTNPPPPPHVPMQPAVDWARVENIIVSDSKEKFCKAKKSTLIQNDYVIDLGLPIAG